MSARDVHQITPDRVTLPPRVDDDFQLLVPARIAERAVPQPSPESEAYWAGLSRNELVLDRCSACKRYSHYPTGGCSWCGAAGTVPAVVSATGTVYSFTVSQLEFGPGMLSPYVVVAVEPDCQPGVKLLGNLVGCRIRDAVIGLPVRGVFTHDGDRSLLFWEPTGDPA